MIFDLNQKPADAIAMVDDQSHVMSYGQLCAFADRVFQVVNTRTLVFILCENSVAAAAGYVACLARHIVPLMLGASLDRQLLDGFITTYQPSHIWLPQSLQEHYPFPVVYAKLGYVLLATGLPACPMHPDLSLLLPTSGSTGSPKLVRHSYGNVQANAQAVATVFGMDVSERGMVSLPIQYTQGLNIVSSHLQGGSTILLSKASLTEKEFWDFFKTQRATSLTGVPYSIEVLSRLRFFRMDLPDFRTLNQGGGRMTDKLFGECAEYAERTGRRFIATYGATETTARMAYLPPNLAIRKCGSIGYAIPGGSITLVNDEGQTIDRSGKIGEIIYQGPNVTLGYAESLSDLLLSDERHGRYATGDLAWRDDDGCHYIVGRKSRFLKLYGYRIGLDETERLIRGAFSLECACTGTDRQMLVYITNGDKREAVLRFLSEKTGLQPFAFEIRVIDTIPKNPLGKILYNHLP